MLDKGETGQILLCHDCDLAQRWCALPARGCLCCRRCGAILWRASAMNLSARCALALAGLMAFVLACSMPIVALSRQGMQTVATLPATVLALWRQGQEPVALLVAATAMVIPALELLLLCYFLTALTFARIPPGFKLLLQCLPWLAPWGMSQVFLMGVLVALVKLARFADVTLGVGLWSYALLMLLMVLNASSLDARRLWNHYLAIVQR